jgi:hypothetical protein
MPPAAQQETLQTTSTDTFTITHPDELESMVSIDRIKTNRAVLEKAMPEMKGRSLNYSLCPYVTVCCNHNGILTSICELITPYQHPLVDQVPGVQGLHLAIGGSYHSFKFLPVFGILWWLTFEVHGLEYRKDGAGIELRKRYLSIVRYYPKLQFGCKIYKIRQDISQISPFHQDILPSVFSSVGIYGVYCYDITRYKIFYNLWHIISYYID